MKKLTITHLKTSAAGNTYVVGTVESGDFIAYGKVLTKSNDNFTVGQIADVPEKMIVYF